MSYSRFYQIFVLPLAASLLFACGPPQAQKTTFRCSDVEAQRGTVAMKITAKGRVEPLNTILVKAPVEGRISEILVRKGDTLKKGQIMATVTLDPKFQLNFNQTLLILKSARLSRQSLERQIERSEQLHRDGLMAQVSIEELRSRHSEAVLKEQVALERLKVIEEKIGRKIDPEATQDNFPDMISVIKAPITGTVLEVIANYGESVNPARRSSMLSGGAILAIADLSETVMRASVSELDITRIQEGQRVELRFDSMPGRTIPGKVSRISVFATTSPFAVEQQMAGTERASRFDVEIALGKKDPMVRSGMSFKASFVTATGQDVILLPITAVVSDGSEDFVLIKDGNSYSRRPITSGISDERIVEIVDGLEAGNLVCARPLAWLESLALARSTKSLSVIDRIFGIFK